MNRKIIILIIIIFCLILLGILGFNIDNDKNYKDDDLDNEDSFKIFINSLILKGFDAIGDVQNGIVSQNSIDEYVFMVYSYYYQEGDIFTYDEINNYVKYVFGEEYNIKTDDLWFSKTVNDYCFKYDDINNIFNYNVECDKDILYGNVSNIVSIDDVNGKKIVNVFHYYFNEGKIYCSYDDMRSGIDAIGNYNDMDEKNEIKRVINNKDKYKCNNNQYVFVMGETQYRFDSAINNND